jgi:hypothetical protein
MRRVALSSFLLLLTACGPVGMFPGPFFSRNFPPPGPPNYQQGMIDGCKTASGAVGGGLYNVFYSDVYYDVDKAINDQVYYRAWKDGYLHCKYEHDRAPE